MAREQAQAREAAGREPGDGAVEAAARRLDRALGDLEARIIRLSLREDADLASDRAHLAAELDASRARERALEAIAAEASAALGRAAAEVRAALASAEEPGPPAPPLAHDEDPVSAFADEGAGPALQQDLDRAPSPDQADPDEPDAEETGLFDPRTPERSA